MNKLGIVLGAAAVAAVVAGCKDPNYIPPAERAQLKANAVATEPAAQGTLTPDVTQADEPAEQPAPSIEIKNLEPEQPLPGTPGKTEPKPIDITPATPATVTTPYIVQRGDYLAKISKKFNVKLDALRKANPQLKNDVVRLGQTIQIPGQVDVGVQSVPEGAFAKKPAKPEYKPYSGETKEYVVKSGDYLGKIAAAHKISIRQLKELNALQSDTVRIGQKLKVPATGAAAAVAAKPVAMVKTAPKPVAAVKTAAKSEVRTAPVVEPQPEIAEALSGTASAATDAAPVVEPAPATPAPAASEVGTMPYTVQEGEDIIALSIAFGVDPSVIRELNNMGEQDQLKPGQVIRLPEEQN